MTRRDDWETPQKLFDYLDGFFKFEVDAAATKENTKCRGFFCEESDALTQEWHGHSIWCNPPYSKAKQFTQKFLQGRWGAILLPVRSDRLWFQEALGSVNIRACWITGRLHFGDSGKGAFMYSIILYHSSKMILPEHMQAGQFNDNGKGDARS